MRLFPLILGSLPLVSSPVAASTLDLLLPPTSATALGDAEALVFYSSRANGLSGFTQGAGDGDARRDTVKRDLGSFTTISGSLDGRSLATGRTPFNEDFDVPAFEFSSAYGGSVTAISRGEANVPEFFGSPTVLGEAFVSARRDNVPDFNPARETFGSAIGGAALSYQFQIDRTSALEALFGVNLPSAPIAYRIRADMQANASASAASDFVGASITGEVAISNFPIALRDDATFVFDEDPAEDSVSVFFETVTAGGSVLSATLPPTGAPTVFEVPTGTTGYIAKSLRAQALIDAESSDFSGFAEAIGVLDPVISLDNATFQETCLARLGTACPPVTEFFTLSLSPFVSNGPVDFDLLLDRSGPAVIPLPGGLMLLASGTAALGFVSARRRSGGSARSL